MTATVARLNTWSGSKWLGASYVLGRDCPIAKPYPHICGNTVRGAVSGVEVRLWRKECAACGAEEFEKQAASSARRGGVA